MIKVNSIKLFAFLCLLVFLDACAVLKQDTIALTQEESDTVRNKKPENGKALLFFIREGAYAGGGTLTGVDPGIGKLFIQGNKSVVALPLTPGKYKIRIHQLSAFHQEGIVSYEKTSINTDLGYGLINTKAYKTLRSGLSPANFTFDDRSKIDKTLINGRSVMIAPVGKGSYTESEVEVKENQTYCFKYKASIGKDVMNDMRMHPVSESEARKLISQSKCSITTFAMSCPQLGVDLFMKYENAYFNCKFTAISGFKD